MKKIFHFARLFDILHYLCRRIIKNYICMLVKITFPDGTVREYEQGVTGLQIAESISPALARDVVSCGVNGETVELNRPINEDATVELYKFDRPWRTDSSMM